MSGTDVCCSIGLLWTTLPECLRSPIPVSLNCTILAGGRPCVNSSGRWCRDNGLFRLPFVQCCEAVFGGLRSMIIGRNCTGNFKCVFHPDWSISLKDGTVATSGSYYLSICRSLFTFLINVNNNTKSC